jgi:CHAT domain-containing protein
MRPALVPVLVASLLWARAAGGDDEAPPLDRIRAAVTSGSVEDVRRIVAQSGIDPWDLVDQLRATAAWDHARFVAEAVESPDGVALRAFAGAPPKDDATRRAPYQAALRTAEVEAARAALPPEGDHGPDVLGIRLAQLRARLAAEANDPEAALGALGRAAEDARALGWFAGEAEVLAAEIELRSGAGDHAGVITRASRLDEIGRAIARDVLAPVEPYRGIAFASLAQYAEAARSFDRALTHFTTTGNVPAQVSLLQLLSGVRAKTAEYAQALELLERAAGLLPTAADAATRAEILVDEGDLWTELGEYDVAERLYAESWSTLGGTRSASRAHALASRAWLAHLTDDSEEAVDGLKRALAEFEALGDPAARANVLRALGQVEFDLGRTDEAVRRYREAIPLQEQAPSEAAHTWICLAQALRRVGNATEAAAARSEAARRLRATDTRDFEVLLHREEAEAALASGDVAGAVDAARRALLALRHVVGGLSDAGRLGTESHRDRSPVFDVALRAAVASDDPAVLCEFLERTRANSLLYALGDRALLRDRPVPTALREREERARASLARAREIVAKTRESGGRPSREQADAVERAEIEFQQALDAVQRDARRSRGVAEESVADLGALQGALRADEALVYYVLLPETARALVVTRDGAHLRTMPDGTAAALHRSSSNVRRGSTEDAERVLAHLGAALLEPLGLPPRILHLHVVPDGAVAHVPMVAVARERDLRVAFVPSGAVWTRLAAEPASGGSDVLALGDPVYRGRPQRMHATLSRSGDLLPLPGTREEILAITRGEDVRLLGEEATETRLRAAVRARPRWRALHLACHGVVDANRPGMSGLALTAGDGDDGLWTALEIFCTPMEADLVVLSACSTGVGRVVRSEGVMSLARAALASGLPRVVVSLWPVDDAATRALMVAFYRLWRDEGQPAAVALSGAQRLCREDPRWRHPRYWAGWVLWGRSD